MKKKLVATLAAAMILGVAGTSFAAINPFVDVPAKHWSYDSVAKLAKAGVIDGYGDGTFRGDKTVTRYEMAQMVAKAMGNDGKATAAQKAEIKKLEAEFSDELDKLGVRVSKLEKKIGNVKVSGDARVRFVDDRTGNTKFHERLRINFNADVNDKTSFYGRFMILNHQEFGTASNIADTNEVTDAAFTTKNILGTSNTETTLGRFSQKFLTTGYFVDTIGLVDGAKITVGNKLKVTAGFANFSQTSGAKLAGYEVNGSTITGVAAKKGALEEAAFAEASYNTSKVTNVKAMMLKEQTGVDSDFDIKGASFSTKLSKQIGLIADYSVNTAQDDAKTIVYRLTYKGANKNAPGSYGVYGEYRRFDLGASHSGLSGALIPVDNVKGGNVGIDYTLANNVVFNAMATFDSKVASTGKDTNNYVRAQVNYMF